MSFGAKLRENMDGLFAKPKADIETTKVYRFDKQDVIRALAVEGNVIDMEIDGSKVVITVKL